RRTVLRASLPTDEDELSIVTRYKPADHGSNRTAFLIGMPHQPGTYAVQLALARPGLPALPGVSIPIDVVAPAEAEHRAAALALAGTPLEAARRVAWLREQQVPRLAMVDFRFWERQLHDEQAHRSKLSGAALRAMRANAELADLRGVTPGIAGAELVAIRRVLATCAPGADAARALCLGRAIDNLRRLGYLGVLDRMPAAASELAELRDRSARWPTDQRYRALVGIVLAEPSDLVAQHALVEARAAMTTTSFPPL
ncbi:MAG TPA: hypothetical protein VLT45_14285, partial [Kofleriaceae bacterium]|nr:hypothetical protein [Kofleriaceae bacterium]